MLSILQIQKQLYQRKDYVLIGIPMADAMRMPRVHAALITRHDLTRKTARKTKAKAAAKTKVKAAEAERVVERARTKAAKRELVLAKKVDDQVQAAREKKEKDQVQKARAKVDDQPPKTAKDAIDVQQASTLQKELGEAIAELESYIHSRHTSQASMHADSTSMDTV